MHKLSDAGLFPVYDEGEDPLGLLWMQSEATPRKGGPKGDFTGLIKPCSFPPLTPFPFGFPSRGFTPPLPLLPGAVRLRLLVQAGASRIVRIG